MIKKIIGVFVLGLLAGGIIGYQQVSSMSSDVLLQVTAQLGSVNVLIGSVMLQTAVLSSLAAWLGFRLAPKTNLDKAFKISKAAVMSTLLIGAGLSLFMALAEKLFFVKALGLSESYGFSWLYFAASVLYGGIVEEIMLRWGLMSLIVWCGMKLKKGEATNGLYIISIVLSAIFFAAGHLPTTFQLLGSSAIVIVRAMVLNFVPGLGLGYLYWKHGIGYAILGHMTVHVFNQLILFPLLF